MKVCIVIVLVVVTSSLGNLVSRSIEEECKSCTAEGNKMFIKILHSPFSRAKYVCRDSALLLSKFGIVADRSCSPEQCKNITNRPVMRTFSWFEVFFEDSDFSANSNHIQVLTIIKDYLEILLVSIMIGRLLLKKSILETGFKKNLKSFSVQHIRLNLKP